MTTAAPALVLLITQVSDATALAAACAVAKIDIEAFDTDAGAVAVLTSTADWQAVAAGISGLLRQAPVLVLASDGDQIAASRWIGGCQDCELATGVVLSALPTTVSDILAGTADPASISTVSSNMSRWKAMRILVKHRARR